MTTEDLDEIVSRLRRTSNDSLGGESLQKALARITKAQATDWRTVMRRIAELIDRGVCHNVYDESECGACDNGFECSVCGCRVEDEEHYHVSGTWNWCPNAARECGRKMSDVYKLTQKSVWTNNVGRHTTWYLLDEHKMGYYIDYIEWTVQRDWGLLRLNSECMAFRYNGKRGCVTSWRGLDTVCGMGPQEAFETICEHLGIKVRYL